MSESDLTLVMDFGGTKTKLGVVRGSESLIAGPVSKPTGDFAKDSELRANVAAVIEQDFDIRLDCIDRTNIAVHGTVADNKLVTTSRNGLGGLVDKDLGKLLGLPFGCLVNDANAAGLGAIRAFGSDPPRPTCVLTLGTDVGFAIVDKGDNVKLDVAVPSEYKQVCGGRRRSAHYLLGSNGYRRAGSDEKYTVLLRGFLLHVAKVKQVRSFVVFGGLSRQVAEDHLGGLSVFLDPEKQYEHILVGLSRA